MTLAALGADGWHQEVCEPTGVVNWRPGSIGSWLGTMRKRGVDVLYVHSSALELLGLPAELEEPPPGERRPRHPWLEGVTFEGQRVSHSALAPSIECAGLEVLIGAYQGGAGDPFDAARDAGELLAAAIEFRGAFAGKGRPRGWTYRNSAAQTGWKLMHAPWERGARRARVAELDRNPPPELEGAPGQVEIPYGGRWAYMGRESRGAPGAVAKRKPLAYVMGWDVNAQRLAATARLSLGIGELEHVRWDDAGESFDAKLPGYHLVRSIEHQYPGLIPQIFEPGWHTTPRLAMARYLGIHFELEQSWVWRQHVPYLNPWYEAMRDARARLLEGVSRETPGAAVALGALKQSYLQPLGRLRSTRAGERGDTLYRPDWYDHVIGQELAREYLRLHQLAQSGVAVLAVYFDTIIIESDSCDPVAGAPGAIDVSAQLGKYKPVGVLDAETAHAALYGGERSPDVGALVKALKAAGVPSTPRQANGGGPSSAVVPAALSAFTRPTHGGYSPPLTLEAGLLELARQGVHV